MATALTVQNHLAYALNHRQNYECVAKGSLQKVHKFGHEWIEPREKFAVAGYQAQIGVIHSLASAIFHTLWSMTAGKVFTDKEARSFAVQSWKDVGSNLVCALKAILGVISPSVADWADKKFQSVRKDVEIEVEEAVQSDDEGNISDDDINVSDDEGIPLDQSTLRPKDEDSET